MSVYLYSLTIGGLTCKGSGSLVITNNSFKIFVIFSVCINLSSLLLLPSLGEEAFACKGRSSFFSSVAFPLGGASVIVSENPDAFGVFECPHLYRARKILNFVPCRLIMISKHDFIKAAMGLCS